MENGDSVPAGVDSVAEKVDLVAASWNGSKSGLSASKSGGSKRLKDEGRNNSRLLCNVY